VSDNITGVKCPECGVIVISRYSYDFVYCDCPNETFMDGGQGSYFRYGGHKMPEPVTVPIEDSKDEN
jgi:ssDNA-binding Zn-finger/Zn-ribbon topoisomerase 1